MKNKSDVASKRKLIKRYVGRFKTKYFKIDDDLFIRVESAGAGLHLYQQIFNNELDGCFIVGFSMYDTMIPITEQEWREEYEKLKRK